jgi:hypothetical protein
MSVSPAPVLSAIAFQLAAAAERYEREVDQMLQHPADLALYQRVSGRMDEMRLYAGALPALSVPWVEVLIRHFEVTHGLWRLQQGQCEPHALLEVRAQHHQAVEALLRRVHQGLPKA